MNKKGVLSERLFMAKPSELGKPGKLNSHGRFLRPSYALTLAALLPLPASQVFAADDSAMILEEIIVTARKRAESLQDVPVAITAFSAGELQRFNMDSFEQISTMTPQLLIGPQATQTGGTITLRGIGAGSSNPATDQAVSINLDNIQVSQANVLRLGQYDLRQVEILKGPQALFFGKNSPGGIISAISQDPGDEFEGQLRLAYNFEREKRVLAGIISGPLSDSVGARLAVYGSAEDGWIKNIAEPINLPGLVVLGASSENAQEQDEIFARLTLTYSNDDKVNVKWKTAYDKLERDNGGPASGDQISECSLGFAQISANTATGGLVGVVDNCQLGDTVIIPRAEPGVAALHPSFGDGTPYLESTQLLSVVEFQYRLNDALSLTSVTGYYNIEEDSFDNFSQTDLNLVHATSLLENEQITQEFRIQSDYSGPFNFVAGAFYQDAELTNLIPLGLGTQATGAPLLAALPDWKVETESLSLFGQLVYQILPELELSVGARWTDEEKQLSGTSFGMPMTIDPRFDEVSNSNTSPEVTLKYDFSDDHMLYVAYKEGFVSGGFNITTTQPVGIGIDSSFEPSTVTGFEVGVKGTALSGNFRYDSVVYNYDYEDMQLSTFDASTLALSTLNAGEATVRGLELSGTYLFESVDGLLVNASLAYNDAEYDRFIAACYAGQSIAEGCNLNLGPTGAFASQDLAGQELARAPEFSGTLGASYDTNISSGLGLTVSAQANYTGEYNAHDDNDPRAIQDSYWIYNANITLYSVDKSWQLALIGKNLGDELVAISTRGKAFGGVGTGTNNAILSDLASVINTPREVVVEFSYNF